MVVNKQESRAWPTFGWSGSADGFGMCHFHVPKRGAAGLPSCRRGLEAGFECGLWAGLLIAVISWIELPRYADVFECIMDRSVEQQGEEGP